MTLGSGGPRPWREAVAYGLVTCVVLAGSLWLWVQFIQWAVGR